jgi:hypothetical protein
MKSNETVSLGDFVWTFNPYRYLGAVRQSRRNPHDINRWTYSLVTNEISVKIQGEGLTFFCSYCFSIYISQINNQLEDIGLNERIILKCTVKKYGGGDCIHVTQARDEWRVLVNIGMNFRVSKNAASFLLSRESFRFVIGILFHELSSVSQCW